MNKLQIRESLSGVFAPICTPFTESGEVNYEGLKENMAKYAASKLKGYLALGSNGENKSLSMDEKFKVLEIIVKNKGPHQVVMTGCIAESTRGDHLHRQESRGDSGPISLPCFPPTISRRR